MTIARTTQEIRRAREKDRLYVCAFGANKTMSFLIGQFCKVDQSVFIVGGLLSVHRITHFVYHFHERHGGGRVAHKIKKVCSAAV